MTTHENLVRLQDLIDRYSVHVLHSVVRQPTWNRSYDITTDMGLPVADHPQMARAVQAAIYRSLAASLLSHADGMDDDPTTEAAELDLLGIELQTADPVQTLRDMAESLGIETDDPWTPTRWQLDGIEIVHTKSTDRYVVWLGTRWHDDLIGTADTLDGAKDVARIYQENHR